MLTKQEALKLISDKLQQISPKNDPFVVVEADTIEKPYGWVFFYNSKKFLDTGIFRYRLAGNGPAIVNKNDGTVQLYGTAKPPLAFIEEYEQEISKRVANFNANNV